MSEVNIPLLRKMVEWVEEQEQLTENREWYQSDWFTEGIDSTWFHEAEPLHRVTWCETAYCLAGKVALDDGWKPIDFTGASVRKDGEVRLVAEVASDLLGLPDTGVQPVAHELFMASNTAADIRQIAERLAGERL